MEITGNSLGRSPESGSQSLSLGNPLDKALQRGSAKKFRTPSSKVREPHFVLFGLHGAKSEEKGVIAQRGLI